MGKEENILKFKPKNNKKETSNILNALHFSYIMTEVEAIKDLNHIQCRPRHFVVKLCSLNKDPITDGAIIFISKSFKKTINNLCILLRKTNLIDDAKWIPNMSSTNRFINLFVELKDANIILLIEEVVFINGEQDFV